jgi:SPP1 family phage portal protein
VQEVVDQHVGFAFNEPAMFQARGKVDTPDQREDDEKPRDAFEQYDDTKHLLRLNTLDMELYRECLVSGYAVEIHSFDNKADEGEEVEITQVPAREIVLVTDGNNDIMVVIRRVQIDANTFWRGAFQREPVDLVVVYDEVAITEFTVQNSKDEVAVAGQAPTQTLKPLTQSTLHGFAQMPVVVYSISKKRKALVDDQMLGLQDHLNSQASANGNAVEENSKNKWKVKGYDTQDPKSRVAFKDALAEGFIFVDQDGDVESMRGGNEVAEVQYQYEQTRSALFESGAAVDVRKIVGTTGSTSGIALKLMWLPTEDRSALMTGYFKDGLRSRIDLLNERLEGLEKKDLMMTNYEITIDYRQVINETEVWTALTSLKDIIPDSDIVAKVPGEEDPKGTYARLLEQREQSVDAKSAAIESALANGPVQTQAAISGARKDRAAQSATVDLTESLGQTKSTASKEELDALIAKAPDVT